MGVNSIYPLFVALLIFLQSQCSSGRSDPPTITRIPEIPQACVNAEEGEGQGFCQPDPCGAALFAAQETANGVREDLSDVSAMTGTEKPSADELSRLHDLSRQLIQAQQQIVDLGGDYRTCCQNIGGDPAFGYETPVVWASLTLVGSGDGLIGKDVHRTRSLDGVHAIVIGCQYDQWSLVAPNQGMVGPSTTTWLTGVESFGTIDSVVESPTFGAAQIKLCFDLEMTVGGGPDGTPNRMGSPSESDVSLAKDHVCLWLSTEAETGESSSSPDGVRFGVGDMEGVEFSLGLLEAEFSGSLKEHDFFLERARLRLKIRLRFLDIDPKNTAGEGGGSQEK